jgi:hypothetical protein
MIPVSGGMRDFATLRLKLADARQEVCNLAVMAMRPDLSPAKLELVRQAERSARAEVKLRVKALAYAESLQRDDRLRAAILLGSQMAIADAQMMLAQKARSLMMRDLAALRQKLKDARQEVQNLVVIAMRPDLKPATRELVLKGLESCRAEVKLRLKALAHAENMLAKKIQADLTPTQRGGIGKHARPPPA